MTTELARRRAETIVESLDIPKSYYELAVARYHSVSEWLHRPQSSILSYSPAVSLQGSFRYGTVNRPLLANDEYDLDLVAEMQVLTKMNMSQKALKDLLGDEVKAYAKAKQILDNPEDKNRCWRLPYADQVKFHMDLTPAIPEEDSPRHVLQKYGVLPELTDTAVCITDKRLRDYHLITTNWPQSNPKGFARWFEGRMRTEATPRIQQLVEQRLYASVDQVPAWEWKTPLQRTIQILKRHRDVMFKDNSDFAPISMIITTLAAHSYNGEADLYEALVNVVKKMPAYIRADRPRIPNPTNPAEDFADRWKEDTKYEQNFFLWHKQVSRDVEAFANSYNSYDLKEMTADRFRVNLNEDALAKISNSTKGTGPHIIIPSDAPKPWVA